MRACRSNARRFCAKCVRRYCELARCCRSTSNSRECQSRSALDAMPDGGNLTVSAKRNGSKILICIGDNGHGMTEEEARNLFVPFFTTKRDGTGLGLAHTLQIINEHGGKIDCQTTRGTGSTFTIELPLTLEA